MSTHIAAGVDNVHMKNSICTCSMHYIKQVQEKLEVIY